MLEVPEGAELDELDDGFGAVDVEEMDDEDVLNEAEESEDE